MAKEERAEEARVMAGVEGWEVGKSVYNDAGWQPPAGIRK